MYTRKSWLTPRQQSRLIEYFVVGATARAAAEMLGVQPNTAIRFFMRLRQLIASKLPRYDLSGEVEIYESYFGGVRKGKRGRGAGGKIAVFGLLKRGGKVFTVIIPNAKTETLLPIINEKVTPDSIVYTDTFKSYNALDVSDFHHQRINHSKLFADNTNHINGIENFWNQAKRHLRKFNGIKQDNFYWFLKECEWRFNGGDHQTLLKHLKYWYKTTKHYLLAISAFNLFFFHSLFLLGSLLMRSFVYKGVTVWAILIFFASSAHAEFGPGGYFKTKFFGEQNEQRNEKNERLALVKQCKLEFFQRKQACFLENKGNKKGLGSCLHDAIIEKKVCLRGEQDEVEIETVRVEILPANVQVFTFDELGISDDALISNAPDGGLDIGVAEVEIIDNRLVIATPGDTGEDQIFSVGISSSLADINFEFVIQSTRPLSVASVSEADEEGNTVDAPPLVVEGLLAGNVLSDQELVIYVDNAPSFSELESRLFLTAENGAAFNLADFFSLDRNTNRFVIPQEELAGLLGIIPFGEYEFTVNLVSEDFSFAHAYSFTVVRPSVTVTGQLVGTNGQALSGDAIDDLNLAVIGFNSDIRRVVNIDENGQFIIPDLLVETYNLVVMDLQQPNVFTSALGIFPGSTNVQVNVLYSNGTAMQQAPAAFALSPSTLSATPSVNSGAIGLAISGEAPRQDGQAELSRRVVPQLFSLASTTLNGCPASDGENTFFTVESAGQGQSQACTVQYTAPANTAEVMIEIEVSTDEFPVFTQQQSMFNDAWSYSLNTSNVVNAGAISASGLVNTTHFTTGSIFRRTCIMAARDANGDIVADPIEITGALSAQNVGDSALPTRVAVKIANNCGSLIIEGADISSPNQSAQRIISPVRVRPINGNRSGRFLSIKTTAADGTEFGLPLDIQYSPSDAEVTEVILALIRDGNILAESGNLLTGGITAADGQINFPNLILPEFTGVPTDGGRVSLSVQLVGTIDGNQSETTPGEVNVEFNDENSFTPLFLAENDIPSADRRYGQNGNEAGDDNWALASTITWLGNEGYRFNDISAQHVAQTAAGASVLVHSGHSDGAQIDLRYLTTAGTFDDGGITPVNLAIVNNAFAEFNAGNATTAQERLASWIRFNREALEDAANDARRIYVANGILGRALISGEYSDGSMILDLPAAQGQTPQPLGRWDNRPMVVLTENNHVNHWHIGLD